MLVGVLVFLISVFYVQYEHWQLLRFSQEMITLEEYWENRETEFHLPPIENKRPNFQSFYDFKHEMLCKAGLSMFDLTEQEKKRLHKLYAEKYFENSE